MVSSSIITLLAVTLLAAAPPADAYPNQPVHQRDIPPIRRPSIPLIHNQAFHSRQHHPDLEVRQQWLKEQSRALKRRYISQLHDEERSIVEREWEDEKAGMWKRAQQGQVQLVDVGYDASYTGQITVGTPAQTFQVTLDTGSADLWLAGSSCSEADCQSIPLFSTTSSSTFTNLNTPFNITYGSGDANGTLGQDSVSMAGYTVSSQKFGVVTQVSTGLLTQPYSGLMGLAFESLAASGAMPFWEELASTNQLPQPLMAFYLKRYRDDYSASAIEYNGGEMSLGYTNSSLYTGNINYISIATADQDYWRIPVSGLNIESNSITITSTSGVSPQAAIDTGTTLIGVPSSTASAIYAQISGSQPLPLAGYEGYYEYPCSSVISSSIQFGGLSYSISNGDFNLGQFTNNNNYCTGAFFAQDLSSRSPIQWIVGATFLKNVYSVFRYNPTGVGFAALASNASSISNGTASAVISGPTSTASSSSSGATSSLRIGNTAFVISGLTVLATLGGAFVLA